MAYLAQDRVGYSTTTWIDCLARVGDAERGVGDRIAVRRCPRNDPSGHFTGPKHGAALARAYAGGVFVFPD